MSVRYNKNYGKLLSDSNMKKKGLHQTAEIISVLIAKMCRQILLHSYVRISHCDVGDITKVVLTTKEWREKDV